MKLKKALELMRQLTERNVPFSVGFISCNTTKGTSNGYKEVDNVLLGVGLSINQSEKHNSLIAYVDAKTNEQRHFYVPLLMKFNGERVQP